MKSTGMVRKIDDLGRIVIPKELRRVMQIEDNVDALEIFVEDNMIVLKKYEPDCIFCHNVNNIINFMGRNVCPDCIKKLQERA